MGDIGKSTLSNRRCGRGGNGGNIIRCNSLGSRFRSIRSNAFVGVGRAIARDMASLGALVANFACGAQRPAVGSSAITGDMTLHIVR